MDRVFSCVLVVVGEVSRIRVRFVVVKMLWVLLVFFGGRFISSILFMLVWIVVLVKCVVLWILIGFRYFISIIGVVVLLWWKVVMVFSM